MSETLLGLLEAVLGKSEARRIVILGAAIAVLAAGTTITLYSLGWLGLEDPLKWAVFATSGVAAVFLGLVIIRLSLRP